MPGAKASFGTTNPMEWPGDTEFVCPHRAGFERFFGRCRPASRFKIGIPPLATFALYLDGRFEATRATLIILLAMFCGACSQPRQSPPVLHDVRNPSRLPEAVSIPLIEHNGYLRMAVKINHDDAGLFMLDTGSNKTVVRPLLADDLALPLGSSGTVDGIGGRENFVSRHVDSVTAGDLLLDCKQVATLDLYRFNDSFSSYLHGIVGYPALGRAPWSIDYQRSLLTVYRPGTFRPEPRETSHRLLPYHRLPAIRATIGHGQDVLLIIDTGADTHITLPIGFAVKWPNAIMVPVTSRGKSIGIGGSVPVVHSWLKSIRIFGLDLQGVPVSFESSQGAHQSGRSNVLVGRVGHRLLKDFRLTFDNAKRQVWTQWRGAGPDRR